VYIRIELVLWALRFVLKPTENLKCYSVILKRITDNPRELVTKHRIIFK